MKNLLRMKSFHQKRAFTLVELLVVIAIIAVLVAASFPMVKNGLRSSRTAASINNLRQIHLLIMEYVTEKNAYPRAVYTGENGAESAPGNLAGSWIYWRRAVWDLANPSAGFLDPQFYNNDAKTGGYRQIMWCPLQAAKYGTVTYSEGHGSYGMNNFFHGYGERALRRPGQADLIGRKEPYIMAGNAAKDAPQIGTYGYLESSKYPYDTRWFNLAYEYSSSGTKAMGLYLDGHISLIERGEGIKLNSLLQDDSNLE